MNELLRTTRIFFAPPDAAAGGAAAPAAAAPTAAAPAGDGGAAAATPAAGDGAAAPAAGAAAAAATDGKPAGDADGAAAAAAAAAKDGKTGMPAVDGNLLTDKPAEGETEGKTGEEGDEKPAGAPEAYTDFALPEGATVDPERMAAFQGLAKELNLSQEGAQKLVDAHVAEMRVAAAKPYQAWADQQTEWQGVAKADPEIGGSDANFAKTKRAAAAFLTPGDTNPYIKTAAEAAEFRQALELTGMSNNPAMIRIARRAGLALMEAGPVAPGQQAGGKKSAAEIMYGNKPETET